MLSRCWCWSNYFFIILAGGADGFATGGLGGWRWQCQRDSSWGLKQSHLQKWQLATGYGELPRPNTDSTLTLSATQFCAMHQSYKYHKPKKWAKSKTIAPAPFYHRAQPCSWEKVWRNLPLYPMSSHPIPSNVIPELKTCCAHRHIRLFHSTPPLLNWSHFSFSHVGRLYLTFYATPRQCSSDQSTS